MTNQEVLRRVNIGQTSKKVTVIDEMGGNALDHFVEPIEARFDVLTRDLKPLLLQDNSLTRFDTPLSIEQIPNRLCVYRCSTSVNNGVEGLRHSPRPVAGVSSQI
jgi:hypothetical protein